jgi:hypothetical protein
MRNQLIEACVDDEKVTSVSFKQPHEHPESPIEMAQAIALARAHPELGAKVKDLQAHAILQVCDDLRNASFGHRSMLVMFTEEADPHRELPVKWSALVDLNLQTLLTWGKAPCDCSEKAAPVSTKAE